MTNKIDELFKRINHVFAAKKVNSEGKSILIVGQETKERNFINKVLEKMDYRVTNTEDENEGLRIAQKDRPHLVILHSDRIEKHVLNLCVNLKKNHETRHIPLLAIAGHNDGSNVIEYIQNADAYIIKPIQEKELLRQVETLMMKEYGRDPRH